MNTLHFSMLNGWEIFLIVAVIFLLFGARKLPQLAKGLGQGIKEFKGAVREDEPADYKVLLDFATRATGRKAVLIGVSEGAGLSVLAATDAVNRELVAGVVGLGLSDLTELGWRWSDMIIYLTHRTPNEPTFSVKTIVVGLSPVPLAAIHSTRDEFVPLTEVHDVLERARHPKRLWIVDAANHRFSGNLGEFDRCLLEAVDWVTGFGKGAAK